MLFNSFTFAVFFVLVLGLYRLLSKSYHYQNVMLLVMSYVFYGWWDYRFLFLIAISTCIDFATARLIDEGKLSVPERVRIGAFAILSALFLVTIQWGAVTIYNEKLRVVAEIDWGNLVPMTWQNWGVFLGTALALGVANLLYPFLSGIEAHRRRKLLLGVSIASNLLILGFFKYFNFFRDSLVDMSHELFGAAPDIWTLNVILPVGISFYTFQTMSYTIDVYRGDMKSTSSLTNFAAYVSFFPQLVAGPIERGKHLLPQFEKARTVPREDWRSGAWLIAWGLFKKMVVADNMATIVNGTFGPFDNLSTTAVPADGLSCLIALYAFAFQIYADFSGYTDIARGTARLLGFDLMLNFNLPYISTTPSEFWKRWHISLSSWLRDYLYIPLGGNKHGVRRTYINLSLTMILGGLWHGAAWTFVLWGAYQGLLLVVYRVAGVRTDNENKPKWVWGLQLLLMFHLVCIGWLIFRAQNLTTIGVFLQAIVLNLHWTPEAFAMLKSFLFFGWFLIGFQIIQAKTGDLNPMSRWPWYVRFNVWLFVILSILVLRNKETVEFIYFAF